MKKIMKRKRLFSPLAERSLIRHEAKQNREENLSLIGIAIDRAKIRYQEEKHPGYIDSLIKMFDEVIGNKENNNQL